MHHALIPIHEGFLGDGTTIPDELWEATRLLLLEWACVFAELLQLCPTLCNPMDCSPPDSSVYGILQARILEWVAMPSSRDIPDPGVEPTSLMPLTLGGRFFTTSRIWEASAAVLLLNLFGVSIIWLVPHLSPTICLISSSFVINKQRTSWEMELISQINCERHHSSFFCCAPS